MGKIFMRQEFTESSLEKRRRELYLLLGKLPKRNLKISVRKIAEEDSAKYLYERKTIKGGGFWYGYS